MNKYELALVVSANVEDEVRNATIEQVSEGFYNFIKFEAEATCPAEVESRIRIMENVIRFLIVKDGE